MPPVNMPSMVQTMAHPESGPGALASRRNLACPGEHWPPAGPVLPFRIAQGITIHVFIAELHGHPGRRVAADSGQARSVKDDEPVPVRPQEFGHGLPCTATVAQPVGSMGNLTAPFIWPVRYSQSCRVSTSNSFPSILPITCANSSCSQSSDSRRSGPRP